MTTASAKPRVIVVGGGLGRPLGDAAHRGGRIPGGPVLAVRGQALPVGLRPRRNQRLPGHQGRTRQRLAAHCRYPQGRRVPGQPAPGEVHVRRRPWADSHLRTHGGDLLPHPGRAPGPAPVRRREEAPHLFRRGQHRATTPHRGRSTGATAGVPGRVAKHEWWEFLSLVLDADGTTRGIVAMDLRSLEVRAFRADAVVLATGGLGQTMPQRPQAPPTPPGPPPAAPISRGPGSPTPSSSSSTPPPCSATTRIA